jgi:hypothetical protein
MPELRELTPEELQELKQQGIDTAPYIGKKVPVATDDEINRFQQPSQQVSRGEDNSLTHTIASQLEAHLGGTLVGGATALGMGALDIANPLIGIPLTALVAAGGAYGGQKLQQAVLPEELNKSLEEEAGRTASVNPITAQATDIVSGALASGGGFKPSNILKAGEYLMGKGEMEAGKQALQSVILNAGINPAINTGINYGITGELPTGRQLLGDIAGGALFSGQGFMSKLVHGSHTPSEALEHNGEPNNKGEITTEDNLKQTQEVVTPYTDVNPDTGNFRIDNISLKNLWKQLNPKPEKTGDYVKDAQANTAYNELLRKSPDEIRDILHQRELQKAKQQVTAPDQKVTVPAGEEVQPKVETNEDLQNQLKEEQKKVGAPRSSITGQEEINLPSDIEEQDREHQLDTIRVLAGEGEQQHIDTQGLAGVNPDLIDVPERALFLRNKYRMFKNLGDWLSKHVNNGNDDVAQVGKLLNLPKEVLNIPVKLGLQERSYFLHSFDNPQYSHISVGSGLGMDSRRSMLHEILHAATMHKYESLPDDHPLRQEMESILKVAQDHAKNTGKDLYGLNDVHEMIAETFSDKEFQDFLSSITVGKETAFTRFMNAVRGILGISDKHQNLLDRVVRRTEDLLNMDNPNREKITTDNIIHGNKSIDELKKEREELIKKIDELQPVTTRTEAWAEGHPEYEGQVKWNKDADKLRERLYDINGLLSNFTIHANKSSKYLREETEGGLPMRMFRSAIDTIRDSKNPLAGKLADSFERMLNEKDLIKGTQLNPILEVKNKYNFTEPMLARLDKAERYELENHKDGTFLLRTQAEREAFNAYKLSLKNNYDYRLQTKEPVQMPNGTKRLPIRDEFYHPTPINPKVLEVIKAGKDTAAINKYEKMFTEYQMKLGKTKEVAESNWDNLVKGIEGTIRNSGISNQQHFNASRRSQGTPLPPEMTRPGFFKRAEAYFSRQATDNAYYKHIEKNMDAMSALGYTKDPWGNNVPEASNKLMSVPAVKDVMDSIRGEIGGPGEHNEKAMSSLATTLFIGPGTEIHKFISNMTGMSTYLTNPAEVTKGITSALTNFKDSLQHAKENNVVKMTARSVGDAFDSTLAFADRMRSVAQFVRNIYTLNGLTDHLGSGLMQGALEGTLPGKVNKANNGDKTQQALLKNIDPDYDVGKTYSPREISILASRIVQQIHGTGDARTMPGWMLRDSEISGFFKLSHWGISQTNRFFKDIYTPATKGNFTPMINSLFGAAIGGVMIKELREKLQGKHGQIPSLSEIAGSSKGLEGNIPLVGYNIMAALSYAGFGGMLSQMAKIPLDMIHKNTSQGATFPLDELATDLGKTISQVTSAIANDPQVNYVDLAEHVLGHLVTTNFQLGRVLYNQAINNGLITGTQAEKKLLSDKLGQLRRFDMVEGLPYNEADSSGNPYTNLEQRNFKMNPNVMESARMLPGLIQSIIEKYKDNPDVMMQKIEALKQNSYATMPSLEKEPLSFKKYIDFLTRTEGPEAAQLAIQDFMKHKIINEVRSSIVP